ncbi:MAG TPA: CDP-alcohol phosphatidyltransferase family protein [Bacteroidia bacterium]|nr:CDP-alcohol phosphatidyltransferase family protein [Bacteroidia bacterium]
MINVPNLLSVYRIVIFPVLIIIIIVDNKDVFKWLIGLSFFTDLIDGYIARKLKMETKEGSKLDSIGDMFTLFAAAIGFIIFENHFFKENIFPISIAIGLYFFQLIACLIKYNKISSFHTYSAKVAFVFTGSFFILTFFIGIVEWLFWLAIILAIVECLEEIIILFLLPKPKQNVKSVFHVWKNFKKQR